MILTYFCYWQQAVTPAVVVREFLRRDVGFRTETLRANALTGLQRLDIDDELLHKVESLERGAVDVVGGDGRLGSASPSPLHADLVILNAQGLPSAELLAGAAAVPGFVAALSGDSLDVLLQSSESTQPYEMHGRQWEHLPTKPHPVFKPAIDISRNPGRQSVGPGMWFWAASRMRFGRGAFAVLGRERILACPVGDTEELDDGTISVELFDLGDDEAVIRERQAAWREWFDYDGIEEQAGLPGWVERAMPMTFERGLAELDGGVLVTEYLLGEEQAFPEDADSVRRSQLDRDGVELWSQTVPIGQRAGLSGARRES